MSSCGRLAFIMNLFRVLFLSVLALWSNLITSREEEGSVFFLCDHSVYGIACLLLSISTRVRLRSVIVAFRGLYINNIFSLHT